MQEEDVKESSLNELSSDKVKEKNKSLPAKLDELKYFETRKQNLVIDFKKEPPKSSS